MKKGLIVTTLATLLAVSCGNGGGGKPTGKDWSKEVKDLMTECIGEVLPYVELDAATLVVSGEFVEGVGGYFDAYDDSEVNLVSGYGDKLVKAGFEAVTAQGETFYYKETANGGELYVSADWYEAQPATETSEAIPAGNEIYAEYYLPEPSYDEITFEDAVSLFEYFGIEGVVIPAYECEDATLEVLGGVEYEAIEFDIGNSSHEEMEAFADALEGAGWAFEVDSYGDYYGVFGDTRACVYIGDWIGYTSQGYDCIRVQFYLGDEVFTEWPAEAIADIFEENEAVLYDFPAFVAENATFNATTYLYYGLIPYGAQVDIVGATADEINTFLTVTLPGAGWTVTGNAEDGGMASKTFVELDGVAQVQFASSSSAFTLLLVFELAQIPAAAFPADDLAAAFEALGLPAFTITEPDGEGYTYEYTFDESNANYLNYPNYCYDPLYINNMSSEQFAAYLTKLQNDGWAIVDTISENNYELQKHFDDLGLTATIRVGWTSSTTYGDYAFLRIYYIAELDPVAGWSAEEVAALLGSDVTDVLPEFVFEGATFTTYDDAYGMGVLAFVGEGNQEKAMEDYAATLIAAGFTAVEGKDGFYLSPNEQFYVEVYKGTDGAVCLEFTFPLKPGFLSKELQAQIDNAGNTQYVVPDFSSLEQYFVGFSAYGSAYLEGDHAVEVLAILEAAGFSIPETPSATYGYECYYDESHEFEIDVLETGTYTVISAYYWGE